MFNSDRFGGDSGGGNNSYRRTKIHLKKSFSECESYDNDAVTETNFHSPAKHLQPYQQQQPQSSLTSSLTARSKPKNTVAFQQPLHSAPTQQSTSSTFKPALRPATTVTSDGLHDDFKKFNTVKAGGTNKLASSTPTSMSSALTNDALKSQYLLQQQQRVKEYNNGFNGGITSNRNNELSYSDTYSSSSSDYRSIIRGSGPTPTTIATSCSGGSVGGTAANRGMNSNNKNTMATRKSTQSLCSCDAETEVRQTIVSFVNSCSCRNLPDLPCLLRYEATTNEHPFSNNSKLRSRCIWLW